MIVCKRETESENCSEDCGQQPSQQRVFGMKYYKRIKELGLIRISMFFSVERVIERD